MTGRSLSFVPESLGGRSISLWFCPLFCPCPHVLPPMFALALALYFALIFQDKIEGKGKGKRWGQNMGERAKIYIVSERRKNIKIKSEICDVTSLKVNWQLNKNVELEGKVKMYGSLAGTEVLQTIAFTFFLAVIVLTQWLTHTMQL